MTFDIFCGKTDKNAKWVCSVEGLESAKFLMQHLAIEKPASYFVFSRESRKTVAKSAFRDPAAGTVLKKYSQVKISAA